MFSTYPNKSLKMTISFSSAHHRGKSEFFSIFYIHMINKEKKLKECNNTQTIFSKELIRLTRKALKQDLTVIIPGR